MGNTQSASRDGGDEITRLQPSRQPEITYSLTPDDSNATPELEASYIRPRSERPQSWYQSIYDSLGRSNTRTDPENQGMSSPTNPSAEDETLLTGMDDDTPRGSEAGAHRSRSRLSRVGSRLLPEQVLRGLRSYRDETTEGHQTFSHGSPSRQGRYLSNGRDSAIDIDRSTLSASFQQSLHADRPVHSQTQGSFSSDNIEHSLDQSYNQLRPRSEHLTRSQYLGSSAQETEASNRNVRRVMSRARHSLSMPFSNLFGASRNRGSAYLPRSSTTHLGQASDQSDSVSLSDSQHSARHGMDNVAHELDAVEPETRHRLSASRITSGMSSIRRFPHGLRSRSTRLIRRGEHPPLSQVLQLAAAAIAAQLSGHGNGNDGGRSLGGEAFDGSIQNFVQTLQEAASAQAGENIDLNATDGDLPPVNFMRVFQFPNDENGVPIGPPHSRLSARTNPEGGSSGEADRSVTLVLVGVRSMPNVQDGQGQNGGNPGPSLDTLLSLPFMPPANILRNGSSGALFRRSDNRTRSSRRHSLTNFNFPSQYESQRHSLSRSDSRANTIDQTRRPGGTTTPTPTSESPLGPHPPPSTPADLPSGHVTPNHRPSSASAASSSPLPRPGESTSQPNDSNESGGFVPPDTGAASHRRHRSDTGFARRPDLGSGAARRNGVVEPDRPPGGAGRSWLIYVVGTNVSPDHPAFTMPSLFTDNPSYEDMQLLSTLLGPVKPPVATQDDVNSAGGTYRLIAQDRMLIAVPFENEALDKIAMMTGDRCLICLCDYEAEEQVRQLNSCNHIFHRDCIDEWLTTGRNSCPMCRGQGVKEQVTPGETATAHEQEI